MTVAVLGEGPAAIEWLKVEIATAYRVDRVCGFEQEFASGEWQDKVRDTQAAASAADTGPLLDFTQERAIKRAGNSVIEEKLPREFGRHRRLAFLRAKFGQGAAGDTPRQFPALDPKREPDAVPTEVAEAPVRFELVLGADIRSKEFLRRVKGEG